MSDFQEVSKETQDTDCTIPLELIEFILEKLKDQLFLTMAMFDLSEYGTHCHEFRKHDCYNILKTELHEALDRGLIQFFDHEGKTSLQIMVNRMFDDWFDEIEENYNKEHQPK